MSAPYTPRFGDIVAIRNNAYHMNCGKWCAVVTSIQNGKVTLMFNDMTAPSERIDAADIIPVIRDSGPINVGCEECKSIQQDTHFGVCTKMIHCDECTAALNTRWGQHQYSCSKAEICAECTKQLDCHYGSWSPHERTCSQRAAWRPSKRQWND